MLGSISRQDQVRKTETTPGVRQGQGGRDGEGVGEEQVERGRERERKSTLKGVGKSLGTEGRLITSI